MGTPQKSSSSQDKQQNITMGYPSMDRYMYPPQPPAPHPLPSAGVIYSVPCGPQGYTPHSYAPTPYPFPLGYQQDSSPYLSPETQKTCPGPPYDNKNNDFYYPQQHYNLVPLEQSNSLSFGSVMLVLMFCLIASMCLMTLLIWFLFGAYTPDFEITSLQVSNFSVTDTVPDLTGTWNVSMKVSNANKELALRFDPVMSSVLYKEVLIAVSALKPFDVLQLQRNDLNFMIPTAQTAGGKDAGKLEHCIKPTLEQDFNNGLVVFSLRLAMKMSFMTQKTVHRQVNMRVLCENMQVRFAAGTGKGTLLPGSGNSCLIRINERLKED